MDLVSLETAGVELARKQQTGSVLMNSRTQIDDQPSAKTVDMTARSLDPPSGQVSRTNSADNLLKFSPKGGDSSPPSVSGVHMM